MGKFELSKRKDGEFQFNLKAENGEVILTSEGYTTKTACLNGMESVKRNSVDDQKYEKKVASNGKFFFNLKASNGQVIGSSQMYVSEAGRDNGIKSVKKNAPNAAVIDLAN
ncbi:MAG: YegP family protein [Massilibacteroides sp.]|nr:YegP family protein [Massilibacteroides sp.]MDD3062197.1 YegP family protein [Massilibacteroides sp.]MDD4114423.1 YegP family protein [Massilibacteroides sp.]MDD4659715.1 YegP family protein [Massilibacteroides sp.]